MTDRTNIAVVASIRSEALDQAVRAYGDHPAKDVVAAAAVFEKYLTTGEA